MDSRQEILAKLTAADLIEGHLARHRQALTQELQQCAGDPVIFKRRFRMLAQLSSFESQMYHKIYHFKGDSVDDYVSAVMHAILDLFEVTDRSG